MNAQHRSNTPVVVVAAAGLVSIGKLMIGLTSRGDWENHVSKVTVRNHTSIDAARTVVCIDHQESQDSDKKDSAFDLFTVLDAKIVESITDLRQDETEGC
jgi:hypothetical protein